MVALKIANRVGRLGEELASRIYAKHGYKIIAQNFYNPKGRRFGEIDLVVVKENRIIFVEVKARASERFGLAHESVSQNKRNSLIRTIQYFLLKYEQFQNYVPRVDVCAIQLHQFDKSVKSVIIIPNAVTLDR